MRRLIAAVAGLVAVVAALLTVPTAWVSTHIADEDGYVEFSSSLAADRELQRAFADYLSDELVRQASLPPALRRPTAVLISQGTAVAANEPGFTTAWRQTQRLSHRGVFRDTASADRLSVDLRPLAAFATDRFADRLAVELPVPDTLVVALNESPDAAAIDQVKATPDRAQAGGLLVVAAVLVALLLARRRSTALAWLGLGAVVVAGTLRAATDRAVPSILDLTPAPSEFARTLQKLLADRASDSLGVWLMWIAVGGGVAIVVGLLGRAAPRRRA